MGKKVKAAGKKLEDKSLALYCNNYVGLTEAMIKDGYKCSKAPHLKVAGLEVQLKMLLSLFGGG